MWQSLYEELKDQNFEILAVAQDVGGEAVAGPVYDKAKVSFTDIVDEDHTISSLYNFVNVPSSAWINEEGQIVRIDEGALSKSYVVMGEKLGHDGYVPALRDWLAKGDDSEYVLSPDEVVKNIRPRAADDEIAESTFKLGKYFFSQGDMDLANAYWDKAQALSPDNWNFHRQDWSFLEPAETNKNLVAKVQALIKVGGDDYYAPSKNLPEPQD